MKKWYVLQTYAGSELKVIEELTARVRALGLDRYVHAFKLNGEETYFLAPIEEVITSKSRQGHGEYRTPKNYELAVEPNMRIQRGQLIAQKPPRYMPFNAKVTKVESLHRIIVEMTNRNEEEYLIPADKKLRRDIRTGEKIRSGVPLTTGADPVVAKIKGKIVLRDKVKRIELTKEDGEKVVEIIPERYLVKLKEGMTLKEGDLLEKEDKIISSASGMVKVKEYKDKRLVSVHHIEKRRHYPGYIYAYMEMHEDLLNLTKGLKCRFVGNPPIPVSEEEMNEVKRKAGLLESTKSDQPLIEVDFKVGEVVEITEGPFADFTGEIKEIDKEKEEVTVSVKIFGRETPVKLSFDGIEKI